MTLAVIKHSALASQQLLDQVVTYALSFVRADVFKPRPSYHKVAAFYAHVVTLQAWAVLL